MSGSESGYHGDTSVVAKPFYMLIFVLYVDAGYIQCVFMRVFVCVSALACFITCLSDVECKN